MSVFKIEKTKDLSEETKEKLNDFIKKFTDAFVGDKTGEENDK